MGEKQVLVIGGGAAGLTAAIAAARQGAQVIICEKQERVGKKILVTGNGRCNLTNLQVCPSAYNHSEFVSPLLERYSGAAMREFFDALGLWSYADEQGRVYPVSDSATSVLDVLRLECQRLGVEERCNFTVTSIKQKDGFMVKGTKGNKAYGDAVIVASGGGTTLLEPFGHRTIPFSPVLCPILTETKAIRGLSGLRIRCSAVLMERDTVIGEETGELLFRDYGVSGVMVFDLSRFAKEGQTLVLDLFPDESEETLQARFAARAKLLSVRDTGDYLTGIFQKRIAQTILRRAGSTDAAALAAAVKQFPLRVLGNSSEQQAQVTRGGAEVRDFSKKTMRSRGIPGLYAVGEALDIDGRCGGYNLHWAFASGLAAGEDAGRTEL